MAKMQATLPVMALSLTVLIIGIEDALSCAFMLILATPPNATGSMAVLTVL